MAKVNIQTIDNLQNETSAIGRINSNFAALQAIIETLLSRDGLSPNQMVALLDMNNRKIINLPVPATPTEPARHGDIQQYVDQAEDAAEAAEEARDIAQEAKTTTVLYWTDFMSRYIGSHASAPTVDAAGNAVTEGALYFNTVNETMYVYVVEVVDQINNVVVSEWRPFPSASVFSTIDVTNDGIEMGSTLVWNSSANEFQPVAYDVQYDFMMYLEGLMSEGESLYRLSVLRPFQITDSVSRYEAKARVAPVSTKVLSLRKNGVEFGTVTFAAASTTGAFSVPTTVSFIKGDVFEIVAPSIVDTALRDVTISIIGIRF